MELSVGLDGLKGLFQPKPFYDLVILNVHVCELFASHNEAVALKTYRPISFPEEYWKAPAYVIAL